MLFTWPVCSTLLSDNPSSALVREPCGVQDDSLVVTRCTIVGEVDTEGMRCSNLRRSDLESRFHADRERPGMDSRKSRMQGGRNAVDGGGGEFGGRGTA